MNCRSPILALVMLWIITPLAHATDVRHVEDAALHDIQFLNTKEGWAVGDEGVIWHTIDGGKAWYRQPTGTRASLRSVYFLSSRVGWVAGRQELPDGTSVGVLLFTMDGGLKWRQGMPNMLPGLNKVKFIDTGTGYLLGDGSERVPSGVFKTTNRGQNWRPVAGPRVPAWLDGDFEDGETGALTGAWSRLSVLRRGKLTNANVDPLGGRNIRGIRLMNGRSIAVGDGGLVLVSKTDGAGWGYANLKKSPAVLASLDFHGLSTFEDHVWVVGRPGSVVLHSLDQGRTWQVQQTKQALPLKSVFFRDAKHGWAAGALGTILATRDGGATWHVQRRGGRRAAALFAHAHGRYLPVESLSRLGLHEGYLLAGLRVLCPDSKTAAMNKGVETDRFAAAVRSAGGASGEVLWHFPLPQHSSHASHQDMLLNWNRMHNGRATDQMLRQLVLALRIWRPDVVVTDNPKANDKGSTLVAEAMRQACKLAANDKAYPEQLRELHLQPWQVTKVYALEDRRTAADAIVDGNDPCPRLRSTPRDFATTAAALLARPAVALPAQRYFRLLASPLPNAAGQIALMGGVELKTAQGARRQLPLEKQPDERLVKAMKARRTLHTLTETPIIGLNDPTKMVAEIGRVLAKLPADQGAPAAFAIANRYAQKGQWPLAQQTFLAMVEHYPIHPLTAEAYRWLVRHNTSSEVQRRYELKQFVRVENASVTAPQLPSVQQMQNLMKKQQAAKNAKKTKKDEPSRFPVVEPAHLKPLVKGSKVIRNEQITYLANKSDLRRWHTSSLEFAERLMAFGPRYAHDPALQWCLQSARRHLGQFGKTNEWFKTYKDKGAPGPWRQAAAAELWLNYRDGYPPKAVLTCIHTDTKPYLDGKFDDACWQSTPTVLQPPATGTKKSNKLFEKHRTQVRMAHDRNFLYLALTCTHPPEDHVAPVKKRGRDADLRGHDRVSIMLDLDRDYATYFHFQIDQRGCAREDCWGDVHWNPRWFVAVRNTKQAWQIEAAIPLSQLTSQPVPIGSAWACNVVRILPRRGVQALSQPANVQPRPEGMGLLLFQEAPSRSAIQPVSGPNARHESFAK